ncbi:RsmB/NOP family class I SAM-dependent RNA methyltransferase [Parasphingopyxis sp. GrpM-11]|uniref:RsmB/NOP family class I SAM-dependent RNA methyltransferase n=1 Tax=Parasphingopyxis marina TaxID=2761622 RepID=A0A842HWK7_9SPHN|nr:RsmB/NOP family class I SAM-dependent RNA methyltransferase [Parasphingopyxis marina]
MESRQAALRLLDAVLRQGKALDAAAPRAVRALKREDDKRLATAIAGEVLRRLPDYDALIDSATRQNLPHDAKVRTVLRMALAQTLALGTPPHAAISTALPLLAGGPRRLAHGVFGTLSRNGAVLPDIPTLPDAVAKRWRRNWGEPVVAAAAAAIAAPPPLDLTLKASAETAAWAKKLGGKSLLPGHVRCERASVTGLPGYEDGAWWVQDIAASIPARLMGSGEGRRALDLCAAPGGKTLQLAAQGWQVTAVDRAESRLARLSDNLARTGLSAEAVVGDALDWAPDAPFDAILLDAPCSATGIFRRHPDVLYRAHPPIIAECAEIQAAMLGRAAGWIKPGGILVYAVCSLEPEEGEAVAAAFLETHPGFAVEPPQSADLPDGIAPAAAGFVRVLPGAIADPGGADGFFIARFRHS